MKIPFFALWTEKDETNLKKLKQKDIDMVEAALGILNQVRKLKQKDTFKSLLREEQQEFLKWLKLLHDLAVEANKIEEEIVERKEKTCCWREMKKWTGMAIKLLQYIFLF